jgi:hypothetical protein
VTAHRLLVNIVVLSLLYSFTSSLDAAPTPIVFNLDPAQSSLKIQAVVTLGVFTLTTEGQGATVFPSHVGTSEGDVSFYSGTINATVSGNSIEFTGSSVIDASITSNSLGWAPEGGGGAPGQTQFDPSFEEADYGFALGFIYASIQNLMFDTTSGILPLSGGAFASNQGFSISSGLLSFVDTLGLGLLNPNPGATNLAGLPLTNSSSTDGSLISGPGDLLTLTIPVNISQPVDIGVTVDLKITGVLVATATAVVPEPATWLLLVVGMIGVAIAWWRQR